MDFTSYEPTPFYINLLGFHQEWSLALRSPLFLLAAEQQVAASKPCRIDPFVTHESWANPTVSAQAALPQLLLDT